MKYYRDVDYFLYFEEFPHMGVPGTIVANIDGTVNIYINTLYCVEKREEAIRHELRHMVKQHLFNDALSISEKELDADKIYDSDCVFGENFSYVEYNPDGPDLDEEDDNDVLSLEDFLREKAWSCASREEFLQLLKNYKCS